MLKTRARRQASQSIQRFLLSFNRRRFSALPDYASASRIEDQVLVEGRAKTRAAILNRPDTLNALTAPMVGRLKRLYEAWEENPSIGFVLMKGSGRAFCCGADVVALHRLVSEGNLEECRQFFDSLYNFAYLQGTYLKPHVAFLDGITMGCGGGISLQGMFRVVTDKTALSYPEAQIGFHPDAGASFYLSRLPGYLGEFLGLTGEKFNGVEMIATGLATHYCLNARLAMIEERIGNLMNDDPSAIETSLAQYGDIVYPDQNSILHKIDTIDKCFGHDSVEEIVEALENEAETSSDHWCKRALRQMKESSPLSLKVILRSIRDGRFLALDQCLSREYRMSLCAASKQVSNDFCEGVRARLVDKDFNPKWDPPRLRDVSEDMVDCFFSAQPERELTLPTASREPYV